MDYIKNQSKTLTKMILNTPFNFPVKEFQGKLVSQLTSSHLVVDLEDSFFEFLQLKQLANIQKGRPLNYEQQNDNDVLVHHIIQSFDPKDSLTPQQVHEVGHKTALEFTNGEYQFVVATHMDKGHLHNHIYINTTNAVTLNKFRWQKQTKKSLEQISDKHAELFGAKILEKQRFGYKEYSAYKSRNSFKTEIKNRLNFLLKNATDITDFQQKAQALNLEVNFYGKYVKYRLLDYQQKKYTRDRSLSSTGKYSLEHIEQYLKGNKVVLPLDSIKAAYDNLRQDKDNQFEYQVTVEGWQIEHETNDNLYVKLQYGIGNEGTIKIPNKLTDKNADGSFIIFIKKSDYFYFINPDNSTSNKFVRGLTVVKQLARDNGEYVLTKHPYIDKLGQLVKEYNYLVEHGVTSSEQFTRLRDTLNQQLKDTRKVLKTLDSKIERFNKVVAALEDQNVDQPISLEVSKNVLRKLSISESADLDDLKKEMTELAFERKLLNNKVDSVINDLKKYGQLEQNAHIRREKTAKYSVEKEDI